MSSLSPVALFIFNRPEHLRKTIADLLACDGVDQTPIIVFGDGPKRPDQIAQVEAARAVAKEMLGTRARYVFAEANKGLARSIIDGVTMLMAEYGRVIVIEDDLALSPAWLRFLNAGLDRYADDERVVQVSGYTYEAPSLAASSQAVLMPFSSTLGWGTWARAWAKLDEKATGWEQLSRDSAMRNKFNLGGVYDFSTMLERQMRKGLDSWGIRWYWSVFRQNGLVLFPPVTLVDHRGYDGSGTHGRAWFRKVIRHERALTDKSFDLPAPELSQEAFKAVRAAIWEMNGGYVGKAVDIAKRIRAALQG